MLVAFYKDPVAVAWMIAHYGMEFMGNITFDNESAWIRWKNKLGENDKFFIKVESLHLLDPRIGDMILDEDGVNGIRICHAIHLPQCKDSPVIMRGDKLFMWPEFYVDDYKSQKERRV